MSQPVTTEREPTLVEPTGARGYTPPEVSRHIDLMLSIIASDDFVELLAEHGLDREDITQDALAKACGVSRTTVAAVEQRALRKLRHQAELMGLAPTA